MTDKQQGLLAQRLTYAEALSGGIRPALDDKMQRLLEVRARIQELDGKTCTGKNSPANRAGKIKFYAYHGTNVACPMHGSPALGKRTQTYIGNKTEKIAAIAQAQAWHAELLSLQREERSIGNVVKSTLQQLKRIYQTIGAAAPQPESGDTHLLY